MIFYFSGTGNSKWVANRIGEKIKDKTYDISILKEIPEIHNEEQIGFVFPIYAWGIPEPMVEFVKKLKKFKTFTFSICTCGANAGNALKNFSRIYHLDSSYSIIMPSNYIIGENIEDERVILKKIEMAKTRIEIISQEILQRKKVYQVDEGSFSILKSTIINVGFNKFARSTKPFYINEEKCNGCGLCAKNCPALTIKMVDKKPVWNKKCYQCLRCINYCPQKAIQYGKETEKRGRYNIDKYL